LPLTAFPVTGLVSVVTGFAVEAGACASAAVAVSSVIDANISEKDLVRMAIMPFVFFVA
jgi:hypothetical protein